ncbi:MAG TPA: hypothetical protein VIV60_23345 [Polyangiaceae bacterium]
MHQIRGWLVGSIFVSSVLSVVGCAADATNTEPSAAEGSNDALVARICRSDGDCPVPLAACRQCPDGVNFSCPEAVCRSGQCGITWTPCPGLIQCGGIAGLKCPTGFECVDDPRDDCSPCRGGADCGGICVELSCKVACDPTLICTQVITCVDGQLYPTGCGPRNCDKPIGVCDATTQ